MKLDRNITNPRRGKYALIKLRDATVKRAPVEGEPAMVMVEESAVDFGESEETDFFVIRLKDKYAAPALAAYAMAAYRDDGEYALEVLNLAKAAAENPHQRQPD